MDRKSAFSQLQSVCDYSDMHLHQPQGPTLSISSVDVVMSSIVTQRWIRFFNCVLLMNILSFRQRGESPLWCCRYCKHPPGPCLHNLHGLATYLSCTLFFLLLTVLKQVFAGWSHLGTWHRSLEFLVTNQVSFSGRSEENVSSRLFTTAHRLTTTPLRVPLCYQSNGLDKQWKKTTKSAFSFLSI